jgi:hypothetical protein
MKVFRTMTGFQDAYVAAPSRAAALRAWGATTDLFAMDAAEQVTDPTLTAEPLAKPGEVIKRIRGSDEEHFAAASPTTTAKVRATTIRKAKPRPSRTNLEKAQTLLEGAEADRAEEIKAFEEEKAALRKREQAARRAFDAKHSKLDLARQAQADAYDEALTKWRAS